MARFGQIPPYGVNFRLDHGAGYHPALSHSVYVLKRDPAWFIRSDKTSHVWTVFHGPDYDTATPVGKPDGTLTAAMARLLAGIDQGFYQASPPADSI